MFKLHQNNGVHMKLYLILIMVLIASIQPVQTQEIQGRILIDVGHSSQGIQRILNDLVKELEINYYDVEFTRTIMYLDPYDVLVIAIPTQPFTTEELDSIHKFVENGGGLLLLGESGALSSKNVEDFNVLSGYYGIEFQRDVVVDPENHMTLDKPYPEIPIIEHFADHSVTRNVYKIFLVSGCSLRLSKRAKSLAWGGDNTYGDRLSEMYGYGGGTYERELEKKGEELIVMAYAESEKGRILALGDTSLFRGQSATGDPWTRDPLEYFDHKRLALNIFSWLSLKSKISLALTLVDQAEELINQGRYQEAKDILEEVRLMSHRGGYTIMGQIALLTIRANQGLEADRLLEEGKRYLEELNCEEASKSVEKAFTIYEGLGNAKKIEECVALLTECGDKEALLQKGDLLFEEGKTLFEQEEYSNALEKIEEAKIVYEGLGYTEKVEECDTLIEEIHGYEQGEEQPDDTSQRNRLILAVILVITAVVIVALFIWRRSRPSYDTLPPHKRPPHRRPPRRY